MRSCLGLGWRTCGSNGRLSGPGCLFRPRQAVPIGLQSLRRRSKAACSADLRQGQQQEGQLAARAGSPSGSSAEGDGGSRAAAAAAALGLVVLPTLLGADPALAAQIHMEPENALSLPTWAVHASSVLEWAVAMGVIWQYGDVSGIPQWKGLTWGMLPCFFSAMCACTWHFFYNSPDLQWLVLLQACLTVIGNCTCCLAAYRIYRAVQPEQGA